MITLADGNFLGTWLSKIFVFSLWILLVKLRILLFLPFLDFKSHDLDIRPRRNLPIGFEIVSVKFKWIYAMLHIILKLMMCLLWICQNKRNLTTWILSMAMWPFLLSKWPIPLKIAHFGHVTNNFEAFSKLIKIQTFWLRKNIQYASQRRNSFFSKIFKMTSSWPEVTQTLKFEYYVAQ